MRMLDAAKATLLLADRMGFVRGQPTGCDLAHLREMISKMEADPMSDAKMGRWLGWLQASIVCGTSGRVSLEDCKRINMEHRDDDGAPP